MATPPLPSAAAATAAAPGALKRAITLPMLLFFILGDVLGAGVYAHTDRIASVVLAVTRPT